MAQLNAGRGRFVHRGTWSNTTEYNFMDWVTYGGSSYTCVNLSGAPAGTALSDTSYWVQMAQKGDTGPQGTSIKVYVDGESDETILAATKEGDIIMRKVAV